ncbi:glycosyltransferase family 2 protein [Acinetobacter beijerinckii]|jgi:glycosyltransferase involved in cell wall biosynthesis|uniref:glycosyltransferase family 2 protein n=1 Tax=Acinetobacter beijerinckii TaxID=262668 RepID=UPI0024067E92|nr:glycosyltransferase [Acinetobacter beijerinckii]
MCKILSLIIPVYNVEAYIEECLNSVILQLDNRVEVIIINDGTPDDSMKIIDRCIKDLPRNLHNCFIILNQENQGQSVARNNALKICTGDYIAFLDSDDVISKCYFLNIFNVVNSCEPDIIRFKASRFKNKIEEQMVFNTGLNLDGFRELDNNLLTRIFNMGSWYPWLNVYKKEKIKDILFPEGLYFEDASIIPEVFLISNNIYFINETLYFYRINELGSLLNTNRKNIEKHILSYKSILKTYKKRLIENKLYTSPYISMYLLYILFLFKNKMYVSAFIENSKFKKSKYLLSTKLIQNKSNRLYFKIGLLFIFLSKTYSVLKGLYK